MTEDNRHQQLAQWIQSLVEILRSQGGMTWQMLVQTVAGKTAQIQLDDIELQLCASDQDPLQIRIDYPISVRHLNFRCRAETLRMIISGQLTIDKAIATGDLYLRASLLDLLNFYQVIIHIMADSPLNPQLQNLWIEFEQFWTTPAMLSPLYPLQNQQVLHGSLIHAVPTDVLLGEEFYSEF